MNDHAFCWLPRFYWTSIPRERLRPAQQAYATRWIMPGFAWLWFVVEGGLAMPSDGVWP